MVDIEQHPTGWRLAAMTTLKSLVSAPLLTPVMTRASCFGTTPMTSSKSSPGPDHTSRAPWHEKCCWHPGFPEDCNWF